MATNLRDNSELLADERPFARLLDLPGVVEHCELRSRFGFLAFHGGFLEEVTDEIAEEAARRAGASVYVVHQPEVEQLHLPSHLVTAEQSESLAAFMAHVDTGVAVHGYGREGLWASVLVGGRNRILAEQVAVQILRRLRHYEVVTDLDAIPRPLRGLHPDNPVNRLRNGGVQLELPPRVRGRSPLWSGHTGPHRVPHLEALIAALAAVATTWEQRTSPA